MILAEDTTPLFHRIDRCAIDRMRHSGVVGMNDHVSIAPTWQPRFEVTGIRRSRFLVGFITEARRKRKYQDCGAG